MSLHPVRYLIGFIAPGPSREMREVFQSTAIRSLAISAVGIFEPVYLHSIGFSLPQIMLYYAAIFFLRLVLVPLGGRICRRHGYEHSILYSSPFLVIHFVALLVVPYSPVIFMSLAVISLSGYYILFWPGYHANFAVSSHDGEVGREVSNNIAISALASALAPALAATVIILFGYTALFVAASFLVLLSNVPLLRTPEVFEPRDFPMMESFGRLVRDFLKPRFLAYVGLGEQFVAVVIWPLFLALMFSGVAAVGVVVALARLVNVIVTLYVGRLADEERRSVLLRSGTFFTLSSWLVRPLLVGPLGMFLIDSYYQVSRNMISVPFYSLMYGNALKRGVMRSVVLSEMGNAFGKMSISLILAGVFAWSPFDPWKVAFLVAGLYSVLYMLLPSLHRNQSSGLVSDRLVRQSDSVH